MTHSGEPDRSAHGVAAEDLTATDRVTLAGNWNLASEALDELLTLNGEHRDEGCTAWYCGSEEMNDLLHSYGLAPTHMMLWVAIERLRRADHPDEGQPVS